MNKLVIGALSTVALLSPALGGPGDAERGERDFRVCAPCHSLEPDRNMTGPNLRPKPMTFMYDGSARQQQHRRNPDSWRRRTRTTWITLTPMDIGINMRVKRSNIPPGWQA
jgi:hypothetical protein